MGDETLSYLDISLKIIKIINSIKTSRFHYYSLNIFLRFWLGEFPQLILLNPWTYTQILTPTLEQEAGKGGGGGGDGTAPKSFWYVAVFWNDFAFSESLWSSWQVEVYFMGSGAAGDMYFHPKLTWLPASYDVISRNHGNWPSLNVSHNLCEGGTNSY